VAESIPVHTVPRDRGKIALFTPGGAILTDGKAATLSFQAVGVITPHLTLDANLLSGLSINNMPVSTASDRGPIAGGRLAALFATRDEITVNAQTQLDAVARDLVERFQDPNVDPTLGPTDAGLFTDGSAAFVTTDEVGLSGRLTLNALVDPAQGGAVWRIRDGIGAITPGNPGNTTQIRSLLTTLETERSPASGNFLAASRTASALSSDFLSLLSTERQSAEADASFADAQVQTLKGRELAMGVDTDEEMQKLLMIEAAYSANARVIQTVDDMIETLLGL
jgi:flagellar hook-associated protein 1 FlgK